MDPFLIATNVLVAGIGISIFVVSARINRRWQQILVQTSGVILVLVAVLALPSRALQHIDQQAITAAPEDDDSSTLLSTEEGAVITDESSGNTVIITRDQRLVDLLRRAFQGKTTMEEVASLDDPDEEEPDSDERTGRDPFGRAQIKVEDDVESTPAPSPEPTPAPVAEPTPTPTPSPTPAPTPAPPARERTLPQESEGTPICTGFKLLHGTAGGPEPDGCYAVGCREGIALPMQFVGGTWQACQSYTRLPRQGDCYFVADSDGTERAMRLVEDSWKQSDCTL